MSTIRIYRKTMDHRDKDGDILPEFDDGTDVHNFVVPRNKEFSHYTVDNVHQFLGSYEVKSVPQSGASGEQDIKVDWGYGILGRMTYRISVFAKDSGTRPDRIDLKFPSPDFESLARSAINQKVPLRLVFKGEDAKKLAFAIGLLRFQRGAEGNSSLVDPGTIALTVAIIAGIVAVAGLSVVAAVLLYATNQGCSSKASQKGNVSGGEGEVNIDVQCLNQI